MENLNDYLKNMQFRRRTMGGLDEEDVLFHIKVIRDLAQGELDDRDAQILEIEEQLNDAQEQVDRYQSSYQEVKRQLDDAQKQIRQYQSTFQAVKDSNSQLDEYKRQLGEESERYQEAKEQAEQAKLDYDNKYEELLSAIKVFHELEQNTEQKVRKEVRESLKDEEERARVAMHARIEEERKAAEAEIERLNAEIASLKEEGKKFSKSLRARREQLSQQLSWIDQQLDQEGSPLYDNPLSDPLASKSELEADNYIFQGSHAPRSNVIRSGVIRSGDLFR